MKIGMKEYMGVHTLFYTCDNREEHLRHFFCYYRHSLLVLCACLNQNTRALLLLMFCYSYAT